MSEQASVRYYVDENLSAQIPKCLRHNGFPAERVRRNTPDDSILAQISGQRAVLVTGDQAIQTQFADEVRLSGVSVVWIWANHSDPATQFYAVFTSVFRLNPVLRSTDQPLYYHVHLGTENGLASVRIDSTAL